jgi:hypothetical protein
MDKSFEEGQRAINVFGKHVERFESNFTSKNKLPRKQDWKPHRFCVRDVVLALVAIRYNSFRGYTEVDLFATYNPEVFEDYTATKLATNFIISEAFMSGGSMEIHFTQDFGRQNVRIPPILYDMAFENDVRLKTAKEGVISSAEAQELYFAITDLSPIARSRAVELHNQGKVSLERICFMVNSQIWLPEEMEMILTGGKFPESVILGSTSPVRRQLFLADLFQASAPVLGTIFTTKVLHKDIVAPNGEMIDYEADDKRLTIGFDPRFYAKTYTLMEQIEVPWVINKSELKLPAGIKMTVMVRPRSAGHIFLFGGSDFEVAAKMAEANSGKGNWLGILYPEDFNFLDKKVQDLFVSKAKEMQVNVIVCPEILETIDGNAMEKLRHSRLIRR